VSDESRLRPKSTAPPPDEAAPILELDGISDGSEEIMTDRIVGVEPATHRAPSVPAGPPERPVERSASDRGGERGERGPERLDRTGERSASGRVLPSLPSVPGTDSRPRLSEPAPSSRRLRARVMRIPDDEIARPQSESAKPASSRFPPESEQTQPNLALAPGAAAMSTDGVIQASRIININASASQSRLPPAAPSRPSLAASSPPATGSPYARALSTSSLQDFVDDSDSGSVDVEPLSESEDIAVDVSEVDSDDPARSSREGEEPFDHTQVVEPLNSEEAERLLAGLPASSSEMRVAPPIVPHFAPEPRPAPRMPSSPGLVGFAQPRMPSSPFLSGQSGPQRHPSSPPPPSGPQSPQQVKHASTPPPRHPSAPPPPRTSRPAPAMPPPSEVPSDVPEIAADDVVAIESAPPPGASNGSPFGASLPPMRPPARSNPSLDHVSQLDLRPPPEVRNLSKSGATAAASAAPSTATAPTGSSMPAESLTGAKRRLRPWWEDLFNDDFLRAQSKLTDEHIAAEADFIEESLGVQRGARVLDLGCGTGLHAIELTRRGYHVTGYDLSLAMLARAAEEAQERNMTINFVHGDMREMAYEEAFDGIYSWSTSFGYFDEEKNAQVIGKVQKALKKGGQFLLDVVNRDYLMRQSPSLAWFEGEGCICMDEMNVDPITSRLKVKRTMMFDDGRSKEIEYSIRLYALHELGKLLNDQGFRVVEVSGRLATPGVYFGAESPRTLILAEKR
jgi:SAM-dependent methyltransferase